MCYLTLSAIPSSPLASPSPFRRGGNSTCLERLECSPERTCHKCSSHTVCIQSIQLKGDNSTWKETSNGQSAPSSQCWCGQWGRSLFNWTGCIRWENTISSLFLHYHNSYHRMYSYCILWPLNTGPQALLCCPSNKHNQINAEALLRPWGFLRK